jgi:hypothetical protein
MLHGLRNTRSEKLRQVGNELDANNRGELGKWPIRFGGILGYGNGIVREDEIEESLRHCVSEPSHALPQKKDQYVETMQKTEIAGNPPCASAGR